MGEPSSFATIQQRLRNDYGVLTPVERLDPYPNIVDRSGDADSCLAGPVCVVGRTLFIPLTAEMGSDLTVIVAGQTGQPSLVRYSQAKNDDPLLFGVVALEPAACGAVMLFLKSNEIARFRLATEDDTPDDLSATASRLRERAHEIAAKANQYVPSGPVAENDAAPTGSIDWSDLHRRVERRLANPVPIPAAMEQDHDLVPDDVRERLLSRRSENGSGG